MPEQYTKRVRQIRSMLGCRPGRPIDLCFVAAGAIGRWDAKYGDFFFVQSDDIELSDDCRLHLMGRELFFESLQDLEAWAISHNWPNIDAFRARIRQLGTWSGEAAKNHEQ